MLRSMYKLFKSLAALLILILCFAVFAAGCGGQGNDAIAPAGEGAVSDGSGGDSAQGADAEIADGNASGSGEPITLTFFDKNTKAGDNFDNPVSKKITEKTGVTIEIQQPTGNPEEKLSLLLASGVLPDIVLMDRRSDMVNQYISAGGLVPLNDLIDQHGQNIKEMYGEVLNRSRYEDGKNYYLNNWYGLEPDPDRGVNMRLDVLKELGYGERALRGDAFTQAEFVDMLKKFKDGYSGDGSPIPFTVNGEYMESVLSTFKGMYGMKNYYESGGQIQLYVRDPRYIKMVRFMNMLYREGLLDKEWAINKEATIDPKLISGMVMACNGSIPLANQVLRTDHGNDSDNQFYMFKVYSADDVSADETTYSPRSSLGWDAIGITATNKYPEQTIKFMDYLASEEGQYLLMWGVEGVHWDMIDGKRTPKPEVLPGFRNDWNGYSAKTGIRKFSWFIKNGYGSDGTPFDLVTKYDDPTVPGNNIVAHSRISMNNSVWDTAMYDNIGPRGGTPDALTEQKLNDVIDQSFSKMVYAESEAAVDAEYASMLSLLEQNNAPSIEAIYTKNYQDRQKLSQ